MLNFFSLKGDDVKYILSFTLRQDTRNTAIARFLKTGGLPPKGVAMHKRWTRLDMAGGFLLLESDDAAALAEFCRDWSDVCDLQLMPVMEDEITARVLKGTKMK